MSTEQERENRFRTLPIRGRLAVIVKYLQPLLDSLRPTLAANSPALTSWSRAVEIGQCACVDTLDAEELEAIGPLIGEICAIAPERSSVHTGSGDLSSAQRTALTKVHLQTAQICVRVLTAAEALQTEAVHEASQELEACFRMMLLAKAGVLTLNSTDGLSQGTPRTLDADLTRLDQDIAAMADSAERFGWDDSTFMSPDILTAEYEDGRVKAWDDLGISSEYGLPSQAGEPSSGSGARLEAAKNGLGVGGVLVFVLIAILKFVSRCDRDKDRPVGPERHQQQQAPFQQRQRPDAGAAIKTLEHQLAIMKSHQSACRLAQVATAIRDHSQEVVDPDHAALVKALVAEARAALLAACGTDVNIEEEIGKNDSLAILRQPAEDPQ